MAFALNVAEKRAGAGTGTAGVTGITGVTGGTGFAAGADAALGTYSNVCHIFFAPDCIA